MIARRTIGGGALAVGLLLVGAVACGASKDSPTGGSSAVSTTTDADASDGGCPFPTAPDVAWPFAHGGGGESPSAYCPAGCAPVEAAQLQPASNCRRWVLLGCMPCANGCGGAPEGPSCTKYAADGRLVNVAPGYAFANRTGWTTCSAAEESAMSTSPFCAD
jgi:hypothetical protein